jgi:hypothetical protein
VHRHGAARCKCRCRPPCATTQTDPSNCNVVPSRHATLIAIAHQSLANCTIKELGRARDRHARGDRSGGAGNVPDQSLADSSRELIASDWPVRAVWEMAAE